MKKSLIILWAVVFAYTVYVLSSYIYENQNNRRIYRELRNAYNSNDEDRESLPMELMKTDEVESQHPGKTIMEAYSSIISINKELIGWIKIEDTRIDFPVVKAEDNDFYMDKNIFKEPSNAGSIFMDFRNEGKGNDLNTILYGHNMRDGSMFRDLVKYKSEDFFRSNPIVEFNTLYENIRWEIFSVYLTGVEFYYIQTDFHTISEYGSFLDKLRKKSIFTRDVDISEHDQILTLSTCSYEFHNARFVVHAKRVP